MLLARPLSVDGVPDFAREPAQGFGGDVSSANENVCPAESIAYTRMAAGWWNEAVPARPSKALRRDMAMEPFTFDG